MGELNLVRYDGQKRNGMLCSVFGLWQGELGEVLVTDDELTAESKCWEKLLGWINFWCKTLSRGNFGFFLSIIRSKIMSVAFWNNFFEVWTVDEEGLNSTCIIELQAWSSDFGLLKHGAKSFPVGYRWYRKNLRCIDL